MNIEVLWIDDEYLKQSCVISDAELDGINLHPVESHEEGIIAIKENRFSFHAVILDAKVKLNKGDNLLSLKGLRESRDFLIKQQKLPFFIFTGQPDYLSDEQFRDSYGDFYVKGKDNQKLFDDIKKAVENSDNFKIQSEFEDVFKVCKKYFDGDVWLVLFEILRYKKQGRIY
jgi:DNA-binding NtrC family response regulator